jgi:uncharacterized Rossmann fold enzyme
MESVNPGQYWQCKQDGRVVVVHLADDDYVKMTGYVSGRLRYIATAQFVKRYKRLP